MLARFPPEILSLLTEFVSLTDLVLLHACGDSLYNAKMRTISSVIQLITPRCFSYYTFTILKRFGIIAEVVHIRRTGRKHLRYIPSTAKKVFTGSGINCVVPESVDLLITSTISKYSVFKRKPGMLDVKMTGSQWSDEISHSDAMYITHLTNHGDYDSRMVNVKVIDVPSGTNFTPIPGVEFKCFDPKCSHFANYTHDPDSANLWTSTVCVKCNKVLSVTTRDGALRYKMPPCKRLLIRGLSFFKTKYLLREISKLTRKIEIYASVDKMSKLCTAGILDHVPSFVMSVTLTLLTGPCEMEPFSGVSKGYPFYVRLNSITAWKVSVCDFTGIDESDHTFTKCEERENLLAKYPRLSITY